MTWFQRKIKKEGVEDIFPVEGKGSFYWKNPYEDFEVSYRQESEVFRQRQCIEDLVFTVKRKFINRPEFLECIDKLCSIEKVFSKGEIKHWSKEQIREELVREYREDAESTQKGEEKCFQDIYEEFCSLNKTTRAYEVVRTLLGRYSLDSLYYGEFIFYLKDVFLTYSQSVERGESGNAFKSRLVTSQIEMLASKKNVSVSDLWYVYEEFQKALSRKK